MSRFDGKFPETWGELWGPNPTATTKSGKAYITVKQLRPVRAIKGRYAKNFIQSHRRGEPEVVTHPMLLPIPDPTNTVRTEITGGG